MRSPRTADSSHTPSAAAAPTQGMFAYVCAAGSTTIGGLGATGFTAHPRLE